LHTGLGWKLTPSRFSFWTPTLPHGEPPVESRTRN
jgi:hypothetical protein